MGTSFHNTENVQCDTQTHNRLEDNELEAENASYSSESTENSKPTENCCQSSRKNKPATDSVGIASFIFILGGINIAWSVGFTQNSAFDITTHIKIAWFIGAIIGVIISAILTKRIPKRILFFVAICLVLVDGTLFVAVYDSYIAVLTAKYLDGIANGLVYIPTFVLVGEETVNHFRGSVAAVYGSMLLYSGIFLQTVYMIQFADNESFNAYRMQGVQALVSAAFALLAVIFVLVESPIFYLQRNQEDLALDSLRRLQDPKIVTEETYARLAECQRYLAENDTCLLRSAIFGFPALVKVFYFGVMMSLTFSSTVYAALHITTIRSQGADGTTWTFPVFGALLLAGVLLSVFQMDTVGRKIPTYIGALICGAMAFGLAIIFGDLYNESNNPHTGLVLILTFQFVVGLYTCAMAAYLTEAFPLVVKTYYMALVYVLQMSIQIAICSCKISIAGLSDYFYFLGAYSVAFSVFGVLFLPETKCLTLIEAQHMFRKIFSLRL